MLESPSTYGEPRERDRTLLSRIAAGDAGALSSLYTHYGNDLYAYLCRMTGDRDQAEAALQDTLLAIWNGAGHEQSGPEQGTVRGWLFSLARRQAGIVRRQRGLPDLRSGENGRLGQAEAAPGEPPFASASSDAVAAAIDRLPAADQEILVLFAHHLSMQDIAQALGIPAATARRRLTQACSALRGTLPEGEPHA